MKVFLLRKCSWVLESLKSFDHSKYVRSYYLCNSQKLKNNVIDNIPLNAIAASIYSLCLQHKIIDIP